MRLAKFILPLLVLLSLLWLGATPAPTNNPAAPQHRPGYPGASSAAPQDRLSQELNLTEDQKAKVQGVFEEMRQKVQASILEARTNAETELHHILTPQQYQKLQDLLQTPPPSQGPPGSSGPQH